MNKFKEPVDGIFRTKVGMSREEKKAQRDDIYDQVNEENQVFKDNLQKENQTFRDNLQEQVDSLIGGTPQFVGTDSEIGELTENKGIAVSTTTGNWWYWDPLKEGATKYRDSEKLYQKAGDNSIDTNAIMDGAVTTPKIANGAATPEKTNFINKEILESINVYDISKATNGYYLDKNNDNAIPYQYASFSDYIPVKENDIIRVPYDGDIVAQGQGLLYNSDKTRIGSYGNGLNGVLEDNILKVTIPGGVSYIRANTKNVSSPNWKDKIMIIKNADYPKEFIPFYFDIKYTLDESINVILKDYSIDIKKLNFVTEKHYVSDNLYDESKATNGFYLDKNNDSNVAYKYASYSNYIGVKQGDIIRFPYDSDLVATNQANLYNSKKVYVSNAGNGLYGVLEGDIIAITIPEDISFIRCNTKNVSLHPKEVMIVKNINYPERYLKFYNYFEYTLSNDVIVGDKTISPVKTTFINHIHKVSSNLFNLDTYTKGGYLDKNSGSVVEYEPYGYSDYIEVKEGDVLRMPYDSDLGQGQGILYNADKSYIGSYGNGLNGQVINGIQEVTIPAGTHFIRQNFYVATSNIKMIVKNQPYPNGYIPYYDKYEDELDPSIKIPSIEMGTILKDKSLGTCGDSIMESRLTGFKANGGAWATMVGKQYGMRVRNVAVSGSTISNYYNPSLNKSHSISYQLEEKIAVDTDYIIFDGGVNDFADDKQLGVMTDINTYSIIPSAYNRDTILGSLEYICMLLNTKFAKSKRGWVFNHKIYTDTGSNKPNCGTWINYKNKMKEVLNKWGIPFIDLEELVPPLNQINEVKKIYTCDGDGWHPNQLGYETFYNDKIAAWLQIL